jgi:hypothetical protein
MDLRWRALVAVTGADPVRVGPLLCEHIFDTSSALGSRLETLDLLQEAARDMAQIADPARPQDEPCEWPSGSFSPGC